MSKIIKITIIPVLMSAMLFACLGMILSSSCDSPNHQINTAVLFCPIETLAAPSFAHLFKTDPVLPNNQWLFATILSVTYFLIVKKYRPINDSTLKFRRNFLHPTLPRYGPQNQIGSKIFSLVIQDH